MKSEFQDEIQFSRNSIQCKFPLNILCNINLTTIIKKIYMELTIKNLISQDHSLNIQ